MKSRNVLVLAAVGTACVLLVGCGESEPAETPPRPVKVHAVGEMTASGLVRYSASIVPYEQVSLAFKVGGYVSEVRQARGADGRMRNLQQGDQVKRGAVLAQIRESDYREAVNQAQGTLAEAQASFEKARLDYERAERLFQSQSLTKPDYDAARAAYDVGKARVEAASAQLAEAEISLHDTALVAPSNAVVLERKIELGTLVSPGTVGFVVADTTSVKAVFGVPDWLVRQARLGITLPVTVEGIGGQSFPGQVTAIAPAADPSSRVFEIELTLHNPKDLLKPGMIATVVVPAEDLAAGQAEAKALVVPLNAIVKPASEGQFAVFVVEGSGEKQVARLRPVELGEVRGNMVAVSKGLTKGEQVVTTGASLLVDGETVRIIP